MGCNLKSLLSSIFGFIMKGGVFDENIDTWVLGSAEYLYLFKVSHYNM